MFRDFHGEGMPGDATYARSAALVSRARDRYVLEGSLAYLEPLVSVDNAAGTGSYRPPAFGWFGAQAKAMQRWPSLSATLLPEYLGPLEVDGRAGLIRYAPLAGHLGEVLPTDPSYSSLLSAETIPNPLIPKGTLSASDREAVTRGDARLQLSLPRLLWRWLSVEPYLRGAVLGYAFDEDRPGAATGFGVAGFSTSAAFARNYGSLEHRIVPRLELLGGSAQWRSRSGEAAPSYDIWDRPTVRSGQAAPAQTLSAAPDGAYTQMRASVENLFDAGKKGQLRFELGQDLDLRTRRWAESFGSLSASKGWLSTDASARLLAFGGRPPLAAPYRESWLDAFTLMHLGAQAHDSRGDALSAALDSSGAGAVGAQGAGVDALFDFHSNRSNPYGAYTFEAKWILGGATIDYKVQLAARYLPSVATSENLAVPKDALGSLQQVLTLSWDSPCHCLVARARVALDAQNQPSYFFDLDLSKMLQGPGEPPQGTTAAPP
jgi:LPS-assembly protein